MLELKINLSKTQARAIANGEEICITIFPPTEKRSRSQIAVEEAKASQVPLDVTDIVNEWNNHPYVNEQGLREARNGKITQEMVHKLLPDFGRALKLMSKKKIINLIHEYFAACEKGLHRQTNRNKGYAHIGGMIKKIVGVEGDPTHLWWTSGRPVGQGDTHPELTLRVANAFAEKWLGRKKFGLIKDRDVYEHFMKAADWVEAYVNQKKMEEAFVLKVLFDDIDRRNKRNEGPVTPGWLSSDKTWKIYFYQAVKKALGSV